MTSRVSLLLVIAALALVSPAPIRAWQLDNLELRRISIPPALHVIQTETSADFDSDGTPESLVVVEGRAAVRVAGQTRWQSPPAWQVEQARITDLNRDGVPEAALLVWRTFKPWPVDTWLPNGGRISSFHDSNGRSCHMILIGWKQGSFRELWAGSALAEPINSFAAADLRGNGKQYLVTLVGRYDDPPSAPSRQLKVWEWNGFGFTVVSELDDSLRLMVPVRIETGQVLILTD
jgi:hypothetical protein